MNQALSTLREALRRPKVAAVSGGVILGAAALMAALGGAGVEDRYESLVADAPDPSELLRVAGVLCEKGIPHRIEDGGRTLSVQWSRREEARDVLLDGGMGSPEPSDGGFLGLGPSLDLSPDAYRNRRRRSSEGELARTISLYPAVRFARVHLNLPEVGAFGKPSAPPSASIFLGLKGGRRLSGSQARAVRALVSHAVKGLNSERVVLTDSLGTNYEAMIADREKNALFEGAETHLGVLREAEDRAEQKLIAQLSPLFGPAHVRASVTAGLCEEGETDAHVSLVALGGPGGKGPRICLTSVAIVLNSRILPDGLSQEVRRLVLTSARAALALKEHRDELLHLRAAAFAEGMAPVVVGRVAAASKPVPPVRPVRVQPAETPPPAPARFDMDHPPLALPVATAPVAGGDMGLPLGIFLLMTGSLGVARCIRTGDCPVMAGRSEEAPDPDALREDPLARRVAMSCWAEEDPDFAARIVSCLQREEPSEHSRAARLLAGVGPHVAPEILSRLEDETVREVLHGVASMVPDAEFEYLDPGLEVAAWLATQRALSRQGPREARRVAQEVRGPFSGDETLEEIDRLWEEPVSDEITITRAGSTDTRASAQLAARLAECSSPGVALALVLAPRALARRTLIDMLEAGRPDIALWIASLEGAYPHVLALPEQGEEVLSELLDGMRVEVREKLLASVRTQDPGLWERLYDRGFTIRELEAMDDGDLGELLGRAGAEDIALALREAPEALRQRCLRCMPRGLRNLVGQGLDSEQPVRMRDLERARERLGAICRDLGLRGGDLATV